MSDGGRILITGGAGFIGSSLALRLVDSHQVVILDNLHRNAIKDTGLLDHQNVTLIQGDVLDRDVVRGALEGCSNVIHMASIAGVDTVMGAPVLTMRVALQGTMNVLETAFEMGGIERFVDFSTSEVFGQYAYKVTEGNVTQLGAVGEARWTYAVSKLATEHLALSYHRQHGFPACSIRPFNIFGPHQVGEGAIHHFIVRALAGETLQVHNDGSQIRSWCYIDDIVDGVLLALEKPEAVGEAFNIGNPRSTLTIYNLAREIVRLCRSESEVQSVPWNFADVELRIPDVGKARQLLGFEPRIDLEEGLIKTIAWYRDMKS
ncbi:MAG: NAD-dependent epimerase/dehydratase family protein [Deltaproteobacteria bacterium]|nr:NAD-dependent epimerase/dehydratase family protein [Deltaproteobacteria bacterium]